MAVAEISNTTEKERSLWEKSLARLMRNKIAVGSGIVIVLMLLIATFAGKVAPYHYAEQDLLANNAIPEWMLFLLPEGAENYANFSDAYLLSADHLGRAQNSYHRNQAVLKGMEANHYPLTESFSTGSADVVFSNYLQ